MMARMRRDSSARGRTVSSSTSCRRSADARHVEVQATISCRSLLDCRSDLVIAGDHDFMVGAVSASLARFHAPS